MPESSPSPEDAQSLQSKDVASAGKIPKIIKFESLTRCGDEIWIEHAGQIYRLRKTRQDKLILTK